GGRIFKCPSSAVLFSSKEFLILEADFLIFIVQRGDLVKEESAIWED
ncbi:8828_t:CDS:2, partial [Paraglomus occultum]